MLLSHWVQDIGAATPTSIGSMSARGLLHFISPGEVGDPKTTPMLRNVLIELAYSLFSWRLYDYSKTKTVGVLMYL